MRDPSTVAARTSRALALCAVLVLCAGLLPLAGQAGAQERPDDGGVRFSTDGSFVPSARFEGRDRFDTARIIATDDTDFAADFSGDTVILTDGGEFADALAGSLVGGAEAAPIVLTPRDTAGDGGGLNPRTQRALTEVDPSRVVILGQTAAVGADVEAAVAALLPSASIDRIGGQNRFETAALIADTSGGADQAIVARADLFADALVAGAIAAAGDVPILLTGNDGPLDPFAAGALQSLGVDEVLIAGGENAISSGVEQEIQAIVPATRRVFGGGRTATAIEFARLGVAEFGFTTDHANLAFDLNFPDALALGPHAGLGFSGPAPILLTSTAALSGETADYLAELADCENELLHVAGGTEAISDATEQSARAAFAPDEVCPSASVALSPETQTVVAGETATVLASVTDPSGDPVEGEQVVFTADSDDAVPTTATQATDADGQTAFSFGNDVAETVTVTATISDEAGEVDSDTAEVTFAAGPADPSEPPAETGTAVVGHRGGAAYAPENTVLAYDNDARLGVDASEFDLHLSADDELVVIHDDTLERTTDCAGVVAEMTAAELGECDAGFWWTPGEAPTVRNEEGPHPLRGAGLAIPTLRDMLERRVELGDGAPIPFIEIKNLPQEENFDPTGEVRAAKVVELVEELDLVEDVVVLSFNLGDIDAVRAHNPDITTKFLTIGSAQAGLAAAIARGHDLVGPNFRSPDNNEAFVEAARAAGKGTSPFTVNERQDQVDQLELGHDFITTDWPACLLALQDRLVPEQVLPDLALAGGADALAPCTDGTRP